MLKYYAWAVAEKTLSVVPYGGFAYKTASIVANANGRSKRRLQGCPSSYMIVRKARQMTPQGGTILDIGTGWHHHDSVLLYLYGGDYKIYLFDVEDKARFSYLKTYFEHLLQIIDELEREIGLDKKTAREKLQYLLTLQSREEIYRACNFELCITTQTDKPFLPEGSVDFMVSNCVLTHIPPAIIEPELKALRRMLKPDGKMYMMIGHDDHWAFHDASMNRFNYYRYSDKLYSLLFDTNFEYQNRMTKSEWLPVFERTGLKVAEYHANISDDSRRDIEALPHIDERFARYPLDELAIVHSHFLLTHAGAEA
nr:class I SAM-dependent methyltransferase [uncultured Rhodopila sp.]